MPGDSCPFCSPTEGQVFHEGRSVRALWDAFPVTEGHALVVTRRHVSSWFDSTDDERREILDVLDEVRSEVQRVHGPSDFNIGVNDGPAAGQTIPHLHVHLIPRRPGDVSDPRGGVRHLIPGRGNYLALEDPPLVAGEVDPLLPHLTRHLAEATSVDLAVAFVLESGVDVIEEHLRDLLARGGRLRILTGDYLAVTDPVAIRRLLDLGLVTRGQFDLRVFETDGTTFHPKAYVFRVDDDGIAYVGSSNLTRPALGEGVEWNYRVVPARDMSGFEAVTRAFEELFQHPRVRRVDANWLDAYRRRRPPLPARGPIEVARERPGPAPGPHEVQREALDALAHTRAEGNRAGLVVMATGLGKTWLAAFDVRQAGARRALFVAHREEILRQALLTFRRIFPYDELGYFTADERAPDARVVFASVQTLSRARHLESFDPEAFPYIIVDEFHHAAARTYRRLLDHFEPEFLLGLTATPERTDGGDLLALCGENLVYRCDLPEGIRCGLLSPFHYFGVPDEVDYQNIPWRSGRFDEEQLEAALATRRRAENALDQYRSRAGSRTLAFCVSTRHADFMSRYFTDAGFRAAAVHSGGTSAPRAASLEALGEGELDVLFAVDMFNEGVDVPDIDTILMLRPTESRIVWLQQFGRGLRKSAGKDRVTVIDYIGNHRSFLVKPQALLGLPEGDAQIELALDRLQAGELDLPPGCDVQYELQAIDILRQLLRTGGAEQLQLWYEDFRMRSGRRPTASEAAHSGYRPRSARGVHGSWLGFVRAMGDLGDLERQVLDTPQLGRFLSTLEKTPMTRSYKMLVLVALMHAGELPGSLPLDRLAEEVVRLASRSARLRRDLDADLGDPGAVRRLLVENPIRAWTGSGAAEEVFFAYDDGEFRTTFDAPAVLREVFVELARELAEWRLADYLLRRGARTVDPGSFVCQVSHANRRPILFLPDRASHPHVPRGWTRIVADGNDYEANFVKVALNVIRLPGSTENLLPQVLRALFGEAAGLPGTNHQVLFERVEELWRMRPVSGDEGQPDLGSWEIDEGS